MRRRALTGQYDLVLHVGDLSYADGVPDKWDKFMDTIEPVASAVPYMVAVGNHEVGYSSTGSSTNNDPTGEPGALAGVLICVWR